MAAGAPAVVRVYAEALRELTFNCKSVMTELTTITGQHASVVAKGIADAVCARVTEVGLLLLSRSASSWDSCFFFLFGGGCEEA
jgi:hypothetical protein